MITGARSSFLRLVEIMYKITYWSEGQLIAKVSKDRIFIFSI